MVCYNKKLQWNTFEYLPGPQLQECKTRLLSLLVFFWEFFWEGGMNVINYHNLHQFETLM